MRFKTRDELDVDGKEKWRATPESDCRVRCHTAIDAIFTTYPCRYSLRGADPFDYTLDPEEEDDKGHRREEDGDDHDAS